MRELLEQACKRLHLGYVLDSYSSIPFDDPDSFLLGVLQAGLQCREEAKLKRLLKKAAFTQVKTLQDYDFRAVTWSEHCTEVMLRDLLFLERKENVLMLGKVGTGKTHLATALGVEACRRGHVVRFFRVPDLVALLQEKHQAGMLPRFRTELTEC